MVISVKFNEDVYYNNEYWANVGGIRCEELNELEKEMLCLLDFELHISKQKYRRYSKSMKLYHDKLISDAYAKDSGVESEDTADSSIDS